MTKAQLKLVMQSRQINRQQLATMLGVSLGAVKKWLTGERIISERTDKQIEIHFKLMDLMEKRMDLPFGKEVSFKGTTTHLFICGCRRRQYIDVPTGSTPTDESFKRYLRHWGWNYEKIPDSDVHFYFCPDCNKKEKRK